MEQFEQLLTCAICLDRYRNPKLLPCQHSFCMEPCMDGLVDYVRRQVKCPECRAEHRIPYQGVQGYPTNVTLQRFLELHIEITGELPDPTSGQIMERCNVCSEKSYCSICVHCEKKICGDCKGAHMDILRREISRINNQIRRAMHRLQDALALVEKNQCSLIQNCSSVTEEVDEIYRRLNKALKDRTDYLRGELDRYLSVEQRNLSTLKENLEQEISNIQSNCDLADKHMTENVEWDDCELMDAKEIFLKTVEFIRNFEYENTDYARRVRFTMSHDPNQLVLHVAGYGELTIAMPGHATGPGSGSAGTGTGGLLAPPGGPGLMRSKSDHRLASQFRQEEEQQQQRRGYDADGGGRAVSPLGGRRFGERRPVAPQPAGDRYDSSSSRYGRSGGAADDYRGEFESPYDNEGGRPGRRYGRSRFTRHLGGGDGDSDTDAQVGRSVRFQGDAPTAAHKERERVLDTEDVSRGPLSGITRLYDSPRVMKRLQESENRGKKKDVPTPAPAPAPTPKAPAAVAKRVPAARQQSEDDEIARIKKQNKAAAPSTAAEEPSRPQAERVAALKQGRTPTDSSEGDSTPSSPTRRTPPAPEGASSDAESDDGSSVTALAQRKGSKPASVGSRRSSNSSDAPAATTAHKKATRSGSSDSTTSESSAASSSRAPDDKARPSAAPTAATAAKPFQSRFLGSSRTSAAPEKPAAKEEEEEEESESESSSESEETESEEESDDASKKKPEPPAPVNKSDIGALLARSQQARETTEARRRNSRDESTGYGTKRYGSSTTASEESPRSGYQSRYGAPKEEPTSKYLSSRTRTGTGTQQDEDTSGSRYGSGYTSRFLNKSKSTAALSPEEDSDRPRYGTSRTTSSTATSSSTPAADDESRYPSGRSRYAALKDRRQRIARSRSSHNFGAGDDDEQDDSPSSPTSSIPSSYLPSRYGPGSSSTSATSATSGGSELSRSRSTHALKSRENSPERGAGMAATGAGGEKDGAALSSWARYLKNKYGNRGKDGKDTPAGSAASAAASATAARRLSLGLPLRHNASVESSDDDQKNPAGSPTSPTAATAAAAAAAAGFAVAAAGSSPRSQYLQKRRQQFKVGSRGSEPGYFTWPRGIAVGPENSIVVADSSNHRVQVFDSNGIFVKEFGTYGNGEGEFDCLAGVAVNRIGQFIIADRYNHRIQVMDPAGRFLRAFGSQGTADGRFNYPWGITTDALGFIYVCDKENHRVQVFQSDGTFVGKFGSCGSKPGQLEHPHYIAVSNTNRVIVSDSNNHRVQIFDVNGKVLTTFGTEGSDEGQFKFPRHVQKSKSSHRAQGHPNKLSKSRSFKKTASPSPSKSSKQSLYHPPPHLESSELPTKRSNSPHCKHAFKICRSRSFKKSASPSPSKSAYQLMTHSPSYLEATEISSKHPTTPYHSNPIKLCKSFKKTASPSPSKPKNRSMIHSSPQHLSSELPSKHVSPHHSYPIKLSRSRSFERTNSSSSKSANQSTISSSLESSEMSSKYSISSHHSYPIKLSRSRSFKRTNSASSKSANQSTISSHSESFEISPKYSASSHHSYPIKLSRSRSFRKSAPVSSSKLSKQSTVSNHFPDTENSQISSVHNTNICPRHSLTLSESQSFKSTTYCPTKFTTQSTIGESPSYMQTYESPSTSPTSFPAQKAKLHTARIASKAVIAAEGSGSGRSGLHLCSRLREQPNTDLPPGRNVSPSLWMLGVRRRRVQRFRGDSSDVQWQHSSVRQGESQNTSLLTSSPQMKPLTIRKPIHNMNISAQNTSISHQNRIKSPYILPEMKSIVANSIQINNRRTSPNINSSPISAVMNYWR